MGGVEALGENVLPARIVRPVHQNRSRGLWPGHDLERDLGEHAQGAVGPRDELAQVVAGHVFDHLASSLVLLTAAVHGAVAEEMVPRRPGLDPSWSGEIARQRAANRRRARLGAKQPPPVGWLEGKHLILGIERGFDLGERRAGGGGEDEFRRFVVDDAGKTRQIECVLGLHRTTHASFGSAANDLKGSLLGHRPGYGIARLLRIRDMEHRHDASPVQKRGSSGKRV
jgi:hypothetical protein